MYTDSHVYRFGLYVGLRTFPKNPLAGFKRLVGPVEYIRCAEFRYVLQWLDVRPGQAVLDVASPKLLSLFLAHRVDATVHSTDLVDYFFSDYRSYAGSVLGGKQARFRVETQDARGLTYPDSSMDRVFSVSAIEHIPDEGDSQAMREIARVLKPGGVCSLTMPWSDKGYLEEFVESGDPAAYWAQGGADRVFYQRAYDRRTLEERILRPSGLELVDLSFVGEGSFRVEHYLMAPPRFIRYLMLPAHFYLNRLFLRRRGESEPSQKKIMCLTLRKPH